MDIKKLQDRIKQTEEAVSGVQDLEFRKLAFSVILDHLIKGDQSSTTEKPRGYWGSDSKAIKNTLSSIEIKNSGEGLPDLYKLQKGQQILWLLAYGDQNKNSNLSSREISDLASRFKLNIPVKHITTLSKPNRVGGYVAEQSGKFRILQPGIEFLKNLSKDDNSSK